MSKNNRIKILSEQKKRISLRCPLVLESVKLTKSLADNSYGIDVALDYPTSATEADTVRAVILSVRITDASGTPIPVGGSEEPFGKQIRFENGLAIGEKLSFSFDIDLPADTAVKLAPPEVSVSRILFEDGRVIDYLRGDFIAVPASPLPLEKTYQPDTINEIREKFGESARYVPEKLSSVVWRCTCGELCQEEGCAACRSTKTAVFDYFGDTERAIHPGIDYMGILKKALIGVGILVVVLTVVLVTVFAVKNAGTAPKQTSGPSGTTTAPVISTQKPITTAPSEVVDSHALVEHYLKNNDFANALIVARAADSGITADEIADICERATDYYIKEGNFDQAIDFAGQVRALRPTYDMTPVYKLAYDKSIAENDLDAAYNYASLMNDSEKMTAIVDRLINELVAALKYDDAIAKAEQSRPERKNELVMAAVEYCKGIRDYAKAVEYAAASEKAEETVLAVNNDAALYYLAVATDDPSVTDIQNAPAKNECFSLALSYANASGNALLIRSVCESTPTSIIRADITAYFDGLQARHELLRAALGHTIAAGRSGAKINPDGSVSYGIGWSFAEEGNEVCSVAVSSSHTAVLLKNGKVVELDNNTGDEKIVQAMGTAVAIAAGDGFTVVLNYDGTLRVYGASLDGSINTRSAVRVADAVDISAGDSHILVLHKNGTVEAIGSNAQGQCNVAGWTNVRQIAAGGMHSVALFADGRVAACGYSQGGRLDVDGFTGAVSIAAGKSSSLALFADGTVRYVGGNIGLDRVDVSKLSGITEIAAGEFGMVAKSVTADGRVTYHSAGTYAPDLSNLNLENP